MAFITDENLTRPEAAGYETLSHWSFQSITEDLER